MFDWLAVGLARFRFWWHPTGSGWRRSTGSSFAPAGPLRLPSTEYTGRFATAAQAAAPLLPDPVEAALDPTPLQPLFARHPRRREMRRAAAFDALRHARLPPPPSFLWSFIDGDDDVGTGIERFIAALGYSARTTSNLRLNRAMIKFLIAESLLDALALGRPLAIAPGGNALEQLVSRTLSWIRPGWPVPGDWPTSSNDLAQAARSATGDNVPGLRPLFEMLVAIGVEREEQQQQLLDTWMTEQQSNCMDRILAGFDNAEVALADIIPQGPAAIGGHVLELIRLTAALADFLDVVAGTFRSEATGNRPAQIVWRTLGDPFTTAAPRRTRIEAWLSLRWMHHPAAPHLMQIERDRRRRTVLLADRTLAFIECICAAGRRRQEAIAA